MSTAVLLRKPAGVSPFRLILGTSCALFAVFLLLPMAAIVWQSVASGSGISLNHYQSIFAGSTVGTAFLNSTVISCTSALITTVLGFLLAYTIHYTNVPAAVKKAISLLTVLPMLLPTITYGFAILYSFGNQGLLTMLAGRQLFEIYGANGLLLGYVIYTLPVSFLLIHNTMGYVDKKFMVVSRAMGDSKLRCFSATVVTPLLGTLAASFIQSFTLCFTDYGIPASVGGQLDVIAGMLYNEMLGSVPNLHTGSVVAVLMLLPSVFSIFLLTRLERFHIRYNKISQIELRKSRFRDIFCASASAIVLFAVLSVFAVILLVPFVEQWPYRMSFSLKHVASVFADSSLVGVWGNSLFTALLTAVLGTLLVYACALVSARSGPMQKAGRLFDGLALVTNTVPGMVLGVAFLLTFRGTALQNTFPLMIACNIVHFFSSPYLMMKNSLEKLNASWETTARLMGDSWLKTVLRIITPNAYSTLLEVFGYYFVNSMVTVSAVIFIAGARTMVVTAKIKELQHFANFNEIFVLSLLILLTNLAAKGLLHLISTIQARKNQQTEKRKSI